MAEPFVFHFKEGDLGEPLKMYIADVEGVCGLCGAIEIQRFYHATSFHALQFSALETLAKSVPKKLSSECKNCGEAILAEHANRASMVWGFADDCGILTAWISGDSVEWKITPNRRLDPQMLPGFAPPEDTVALTEERFERDLRRVWNPKLIWLELFDLYEEEPCDLVSELAAPHYVIGVGSPEAAAELLGEDEGLVVPLLPLSDASPFLPHHDSPESIFAMPLAWLSQQRRDALLAGKVFAGAAVGTDLIHEIVCRAFEVANLSYSYDDDRREFTGIQTPTQTELEQPVSLLAIAQRAVYTGITPGESARLTAEEIVGNFLGVWK